SSSSSTVRSGTPRCFCRCPGQFCGRWTTGRRLHVTRGRIRGLELPKEQKEAVEHPEVPLLILAGPGSGKTTVLTHRCLWLIKKKGVDPKRLFVATFTNKAANELKERLQKMIGHRAQEICAGTFHSLCARWLRRHPQVTGGSGWSIVDERESLRIVRKIVERTKHA